MAKKRSFERSVNEKAPTSIDDRPFYGFALDNEQKEFVNAILNPENLIVFCDAKAGCGKTTLAFGTANILFQHGKYDGIVYICSVYGEEKQGFLPGTITEKSEVYFEPAYEAMIQCNMNPNVCVNNDSVVNQKYGDGYVTLLTSTFLRGCNFDNKIIILDEAQNYTTAELKKTLTRIKDSCKTIVIGHTLQCDLNNVKESGFSKYMKHFSTESYSAECTLTHNYRGRVSTHADSLD